MADTSYLNWPFLEKHHRELAGRVQDWAVKILPEIVEGAAAHQSVDQTCRTLVRELGAGGWLRYCVPAAYGGVTETLDVRSLAILRSILAYHSGLADFAFAMQGLGSGAISTFGSEAQKQAYLPAVAKGEKIAAFALTEPEAGSDVAAMTSRLEKVSDGYVLEGQKTFISNGGIADFYVVFARTGTGSRGVSAVIVNADTPGLEIAERIEVMAPHPLARLEFKNCKVSQDHRIGDEGRGMGIALGTLDIFRTTVAAASLGFARRALDEATAYAKSRNMFGQTLAELPLAQAQLAEMALDIDASALLIYRSAWTRDTQSPRVTREAAMAKLFATDKAGEIINRAVQLFGGRGVTVGSKVEELYRENRALRIYEGASDVQKLIIAREHLRGQ